MILARVGRRKVYFQLLLSLSMRCSSFAHRDGASVVNLPAPENTDSTLAAAAFLQPTSAW